MDTGKDMTERVLVRERIELALHSSASDEAVNSPLKHVIRCSVATQCDLVEEARFAYQQNKDHQSCISSQNEPHAPDTLQSHDRFSLMSSDQSLSLLSDDMLQKELEQIFQACKLKLENNALIAARIRHSEWLRKGQTLQHAISDYFSDEIDLFEKAESLRLHFEHEKSQFKLTYQDIPEKLMRMPAVDCSSYYNHGVPTSSTSSFKGNNGVNANGASNTFDYFCDDGAGGDSLCCCGYSFPDNSRSFSEKNTFEESCSGYHSHNNSQKDHVNSQYTKTQHSYVSGNKNNEALVDQQPILNYSSCSSNEELKKTNITSKGSYKTRPFKSPQNKT